MSKLKDAVVKGEQNAIKVKFAELGEKLKLFAPVSSVQKFTS